MQNLKIGQVNPINEWNKKKMADQCMTVIHKMSCAYRMESEFLSLMIKEAKEQAVDANSDGRVIYDAADRAYEKLNLLSQFFDEKERKSLIDCKKDFFIRGFIEIEIPMLLGRSSGNSDDATCVKYFSLRQNKIKELKNSIENSSVLKKILCMYLARSNYPKKNAFEILPGELKPLFDSERKNSTHLKGIKILDTVLKIQKFNL